MIKSLLLFLVLLSPTVLMSQEAEQEKPHPVFLHVNLLGLLDIFDGNLTGGIEYRITPRFSVCADAGMVFYSVRLGDNRSALGHILRPGLRYYFGRKSTGFVEGDFMYKQVGYKLTGRLDRGVVNGVPAYQEDRSFIYQKRIRAGMLLIGYKGKLNKTGTLWLEPIGGLSVRFKSQGVKDLPDAEYNRNIWDTRGRRITESVGPGTQFALRLVARL